MGTGSFLGIKRSRRGAEHPSTSRAEGKKEVGIYIYPPLGLLVCYGVPLPFFHDLIYIGYSLFSDI
jgi:hypothetical protein